MEEKIWFKSYDPGMPYTLRPYPEKTLLDTLEETVQQRPEHPALIFKGRTISYAELDQLSNAFAAALVDLGVKKGQRVALLIPNSPQAVIAQLGAWKAGAIVCPINSLYTATELEFAFREVEAETVVVLTPFYQKVKALQERCGLKRVITTNIKDHLSLPLQILFTLLKEKKEGHWIELQPGDYSMSELLKRYAQAARPAVTVTAQDPAVLLFSGGTTGKPKAALGAHQSLLICAMQLHAYARSVLVDWEDRITLCMPMFHIYGNMGLCTSLVARWPMILVPNPRDLDDLISTLRKTRPAVFHGVPTLFNSLLNHPAVQAGKVDFKSIKVCYSAAAPLLADTKRRFEALTGGRLLEAYAMTETMMAAVACPVFGAYKEGSTGVPITDVEVRIAEIDSREGSLPPMEIGEILVRAPQVMVGYWNHPAETADMIRDGWVHTGDIGYLDEDGYLFIVDRVKDLIKPSGFQVWPREVEEVIASHPAVADVCVAGVPDTLQGEAVKAWVVLRAGEQASAKEIQDYCRTKLTGYKIPAKIEFRDSLPKTMVGKTLRRMLVEG
jgi:long-chain acyl-CoA synthetase